MADLMWTLGDIKIRRMLVMSYGYMTQRIQVFNSGLSNFLKAVFHKIYLVHSWILCPIYFKGLSPDFISKIDRV